MVTSNKLPKSKHDEMQPLISMWMFESLLILIEIQFDVECKEGGFVAFSRLPVSAVFDSSFVAFLGSSIDSFRAGCFTCCIPNMSISCLVLLLAAKVKRVKQKQS